ncbi:MAG: hypothetical protein HYS27_04580 [Deltaproteobacteria bacterium]|nr:hypothetical protein [Deltaproteobacteria bacterium]
MIRRRALAVFTLLVAAGCAGRAVDEAVPPVPPPPDAPRPPPRCSGATATEFGGFCIWWTQDSNPGFNSDYAIDDEAVVLEGAPPDRFPVTGCGASQRSEIVYLQTSRTVFKVQLPGAADGDLFEPSVFAPGDEVRLRLQYDWLGGIALRIDSEYAHVAGTMWGQVLPPMDEVTVARGPPVGEPFETDCGWIQLDSFELVINGESHIVEIDNCFEAEGVVFYGLQAYHPLTTRCTDSIAPMSWLAAWPE